MHTYAAIVVDALLSAKRDRTMYGGPMRPPHDVHTWPDACVFLPINGPCHGAASRWRCWRLIWTRS